LSELVSLAIKSCIASIMVWKTRYRTDRVLIIHEYAEELAENCLDRVKRINKDEVRVYFKELLGKSEYLYVARYLVELAWSRNGYVKVIEGSFPSDVLKRLRGLVGFYGGYLATPTDKSQGVLRKIIHSALSEGYHKVKAAVSKALNAYWSPSTEVKLLREEALYAEYEVSSIKGEEVETRRIIIVPAVGVLGLTSSAPHIVYVSLLDTAPSAARHLKPGQHAILVTQAGPVLIPPTEAPDELTSLLLNEIKKVQENLGVKN